MDGKSGGSMMGIVNDGTFVIFFIFNVIQIISILFILIYVVIDVYRRCNSAPHTIRSNKVFGANGAIFVSGEGLTNDTVFKFRDMIEPERVGQTFLEGGNIKSSIPDKEKVIKKKSLLPLLKNGCDKTENYMLYEKGFGFFDKMFGGVNDSQLFEKMGRDPLLYMSCATSKFAYKFSPFKAKRFTSKSQLNNMLVYPHPVDNGTAFILPSGRVINKAKRMDHEDLATWNRPVSGTVDTAKILTSDCAEAPPVSRINVYGFSGSPDNLAAKSDSSVETLVCKCKTHIDLLKAPDPTTYSSDPSVIQVDILRKRVLFPGPGTEPLQSRQVTTTSRVAKGAGGEYDIHDTPLAVSQDGQNETSNIVKNNPVYGSGLVTLPLPGAPIRLNCPCTDRSDGTYAVENKGMGYTDDVILQKDIASYLNANTMDVARFTVEDEEDEVLKKTWLTTGKNISSITCKNETIKKIR
uniref:Envelope protein n=1 Tax=Chionoecetes opilio bacilliform virus TaxID=1825681 RepID=A0A1Q3DLL8_9VIRU|nr:wsv325-like protein [Chionoecetes opilio bacilliform virus]GAV93223.1 envelope protein [Chionoecetes opilio bacilliform virus]